MEPKNSYRETLWGICIRIVPETVQISSLSLPEALKVAAVECFIYPENFKNTDKYFVRKALLNLRETGEL